MKNYEENITMKIKKKQLSKIDSKLNVVEERLNKSELGRVQPGGQQLPRSHEEKEEDERGWG